MASLHAQNIMPLGTFKATAATVLRQLQQDGEPLVLTQHGRPAAVLLSPAEYDALVETQRFRSAIASGLQDVEQGRVITLTELEARLTKRGPLPDNARPEAP